MTGWLCVRFHLILLTGYCQALLSNSPKAFIIKLLGKTIIGLILTGLISAQLSSLYPSPFFPNYPQLLRNYLSGSGQGPWQRLTEAQLMRSGRWLLHPDHITEGSAFAKAKPSPRQVNNIETKWSCLGAAGTHVRMRGAHQQCNPGNWARNLLQHLRKMSYGNTSAPQQNSASAAFSAVMKMLR